ncbi:MAG: RNA-binding transcriptional accessory protein [Lachnospiraceae bacterium]|nr:RNA-binding transcriptional accessory protein [Lachnospiraceae bacterium]
MDTIQKLKEELKVQKWQIEAAVKLIDEGNTIPFIARYRKEVTGSLDDEVLRNLDERLRYLRNLEERKAQVIESITEQGKLTEELSQAIEAAETLVVVEDLYRPYKPKKRTRATVAREKGLEPLAELILRQDLTEPLENAAAAYINEEKEVATAQDAINGAGDIIAENISDVAEYRIYIRELTRQQGVISSSAKDETQKSVYEMYYSFEEPVLKMAGHRVLALNRGESEKILTVRLAAPEAEILSYLEEKTIVNDNEYTTPVLKAVVKDSYDRLIAPSIEREIRNELTEKAEDGAIDVFGKNLKQLLLQPPVSGQVVLGWDPAYRTGCKLAVVDATGKVLDTAVIYPTPPQNKVEEAKALLKDWIERYGISLISVGNGTASRESEKVIVDLLKEISEDVKYVIVSEAGASVYSASKLASEEFPEFDVGQRSAASIARRLQDPLAELVKIDPKSIGVGQYQHDMDQKKLSEALSGVVEDSVNKVGVDLNTASASLLQYIAGINKAIAKNIVDYREKNGRFNDRQELLKVDKLGPRTFEQCAGFMRISDGSNPLDATSVHPESYEATAKLLKSLNLSMDELNRLREEAARPNTAKIYHVGGNTAKNASQAQNAGKSGGADQREFRRHKKDMPFVRNKDTALGQALFMAMSDPVRERGKKETSDARKERELGKRERGQHRGNLKMVDKNQPVKEPGFLEGRIEDKAALAKELGIGEITLIDIVKELEKPARDPREDMPKPILKSDIMEIEDLKPGMILKGTVRNVIDFGVFVDIGVHQDGLVHISQITDKFIRHPLDAVSVGDVVEVKVLEVDPAKKRIALTMKLKS